MSSESPQPVELSPEDARKVAAILKDADESAFTAWRNVERSRRAGLDYIAAAQEKSALVKLSEEVPRLIEAMQQERAALIAQTDARLADGAVTWAQAARDAWRATLDFPVRMVEAAGTAGQKIGALASGGLVVAVVMLSVGVSASAIGERRLEIGTSGLVLYTPPTSEVIAQIREEVNEDLDTAAQQAE